MKNSENMSTEQMQAEIYELYIRMTPENKAKAQAYYEQLLAEQEAQENA